HEWEFERNAQYADGNGAPSSINGALSFWWNEVHGVTLGVQWRYAQDKLGTPGTLGALISSMRYTF
ncbi:MAG: outer membrane protein OmpK, partial [Bdellovibrionales bacterium]